MSVNFRERFAPWIIGIASLIYYALLCARDWTWVFVSGDSGDWLATANWWMVPQPYGSPLYIILCRIVGFLPGNTPFNVAWFLSAVPAAVSVAVVFIIVKQLTGKGKIALASSLVLLGSTVLLTQATVVEEYALTTMFVTLATYYRLQDKPYKLAICIGLGASVHILVIVVALAWLAAEFIYWRKHRGAIVVSMGIVATFYSFILVLMALDTPRLLAGGLNVTAVLNYLNAVGGSVVGQLSIFEFPLRVWDFVRIILASVGLAIVPIVFSVKQKMTTLKVVLLGTVFVVIGYYLTCLDYTTWTFMSLAMPALAIMAGIGLDKLRPFHTQYVMAGCIMLVVLNSILMNANFLTHERPVARAYYNELASLPKDSIVVTHACFYSLGTFYAMSEGIRVIPLVFPYLDWWNFEDYRTWLNETYSLGIPKGVDTVGAVQYLLDEGKHLYFAYYPDRQSELRDCLILDSNAEVSLIGGVRECSK